MEENQNEPVLDVTQDQEELDIFLFTNGEKQTPPRKHHISANELRSWNNAMHILAQSQFGSEPQTMELYTTSGCKVEDPAQIQNFGAYVAVKPEETFVDAGYDKYLIKATRSRERRQSKKNSIVEPVEPDSNVIQRKQSSTECIKDTVNVQTTDHDLAIETVFSHKMLETQISKNNNILKISLTNDTAPPVESRKSSLKPDIAALADEKNSPPTQSMVNELPDHICCQKFPKVVVVQCGCCKIGANDGVNHTCKMDSILNSNNHECYVVIPVSSLPFCECHKESQCCSHTANKQTQNSESLAKLKVDNPVKNISANTSMTPNGDAQNLALSSLCQVYVGNDQNATKYQTVMDNETFHTEVMIMRTDLLQNESHCEHFERRISFKPADFTEKYTQTDWCDVLLEIRGHPDGHYTFHLPSLQLLRLYNLI